jgi:uncharacterized C2H2 Zn-finger protein
MASADRMLIACPRCHSWPMAATSPRGRPESEMVFKCPRCGAQERLGSASRAADQAPHGVDHTGHRPARTHAGLAR